MADRTRSKSPKRGRAPTKSAKSNSSAKSHSSGNRQSPKNAARRSASNRGSANSASRSPSGRKRSPKGQRPRSRSPGKRGIGSGLIRSAKRSAKSAKSEKSMAESFGGKSGSSATGKRVMANSGEITNRGLKIIDMAGQGLTFVAGSTFHRKDVGIVDLSSNNIRAIPPDIRKMTTLVHIDLSKNGIRCLHPNDYAGIPADFSTLPNLEIVIISECNLPFIPPAIFKCKSLKVLDISRNKINIMLPEIGNLEHLQHLNAQQTNIGTLPPEIAFCQELEELLLWGNTIESLPETMREMPKLKTLAINYRSFYTMLDSYMDNLLKKGQIQSEHIPPVVFEMPGLDTLDLEGTKINYLPDKCMGKLRELFLQGNYFQKVPAMVLSLQTLHTLDLSSNMLLCLPDTIASLKQLTILKANDNKFREITTHIGHLSLLEQLCLGGNQLTAVPDTIGRLSKLKALTLDRNQLTAIPDSIIYLTELHTLDLTDNQLQTLPVNFYRMRSLNKAHCYQNFHKYGLWLHKNPLNTPPQEVWKTEDPEKIYTYMKKLQIMKTENLNRQKMIILGAHQCGKTSLMRTMSSGKSFLTESMVESTRLADFRAWTTENHVAFLINDLGGAEVYKNTHHLFFDPKALFLIVYDHRSYTQQKHAEAIGNWLDVLYMYVPGAVVKIVGTQCDLAYEEITETIRDQVRESLDEQLKSYSMRIKEELGRINAQIENKDGCLSKQEVELLKKQKMRLVKLGRSPLRIHHEISLVSCAEGIQGIGDLIQSIEIMAVNKDLFAHAQRKIPSEWHNFRKHLHVYKDYCLTMAQIKEAAQAFDLNLNDCLSYFKDIGDILWFDTYPFLKDIIFTRPRNLVSTLQGLFNHDMKEFLNFETNRVFMAKGGMDLKIFETAKERFLQSGEVSRAMLKSFWFYQNVSYDHFIYLCDLIPYLDLCYEIPQSAIPLHRYDFQALVVIPSFIRDVQPEDMGNIWPEKASEDQIELRVILTFPMFYPAGLLEKFSCRLQNVVNERTDFQDLVHARLDDTGLMVSRYLDTESYDCVLSIAVRGATMEIVKTDMSKVYSELKSIMHQYGGLVWYTRLSTQNCDKLSRPDCFPTNIFIDTEG